MNEQSDIPPHPSDFATADEYAHAALAFDKAQILMQDVDRLSKGEQDQLFFASVALTDEDRLASYAEQWEMWFDAPEDEDPV